MRSRFRAWRTDWPSWPKCFMFFWVVPTCCQSGILNGTMATFFHILCVSTHWSYCVIWHNIAKELRDIVKYTQNHPLVPLMLWYHILGFHTVYSGRWLLVFLEQHTAPVVRCSNRITNLQHPFMGFVESAPKVFLTPCKWNRLGACGTSCICECHGGYSFLEMVRSIKSFNVMSAYGLAELAEEGSCYSLLQISSIRRA
jgi:hypothetical protein